MHAKNRGFLSAARYTDCLTMSADLCALCSQRAVRKLHQLLGLVLPSRRLGSGQQRQLPQDSRQLCTELAVAYARHS